MELKRRTINWVSQRDVMEPTDGQIVRVIRGAWWPVDDNGQVAIYGMSSPICNANPKIAKLPVDGQVRDIIQLPLAFVPIDPRDFDQRWG